MQRVKVVVDSFAFGEDLRRGERERREMGLLCDRLERWWGREGECDRLELRARRVVLRARRVVYRRGALSCPR